MPTIHGHFTLYSYPIQMHILSAQPTHHFSLCLSLYNRFNTYEVFKTSCQPRSHGPTRSSVVHPKGCKFTRRLKRVEGRFFHSSPQYSSMGRDVCFSKRSESPTLRSVQLMGGGSRRHYADGFQPTAACAACEMRELLSRDYTTCDHRSRNYPSYHALLALCSLFPTPSLILSRSFFVCMVPGKYLHSGSNNQFGSIHH